MVYSNSITPPNVTDFNVARQVVRERLAYGLKVLENINDKKLCFGWGIETGASNQVNTIENFKHFVIKNSDVKDLSIVANMYVYNSDHTYLNDIYVNYIDKGRTLTEFHAYGIDDCKKVVTYIPPATLANSDSYAEFFADIMESFRPNIQYRRI